MLSIGKPAPCGRGATFGIFGNAFQGLLHFPLAVANFLCNSLEVAFLNIVSTSNHLRNSTLFRGLVFPLKNLDIVLSA